MTVSTKGHTLIGFDNPFLICYSCKEKVVYWHDPKRCGCTDEYFNSPCKHKAIVASECLSWEPIEGCTCKNKETHDAV